MANPISFIYRSGTSTSSGSVSAGTATLDFGSTPGTNTVTVDVTGQTGVLDTSNICVFIMGVDSTSDHNAYEIGRAHV